MVNGGAGCFLRCDFFSPVTMNSAPLRRSRSLSASSLLPMDTFSPSTSLSFAGKAFFEEAASSFASTLQYSWETKLRISFSRSTMIRTATDCTRPADRPRLTFFQRNGDSL